MVNGDNVLEQNNEQAAKYRTAVIEMNNDKFLILLPHF